MPLFNRRTSPMGLSATGSNRPNAAIRRSQFLRHKANTGDSSSWGGAVLPGTLPAHLLARQIPQLIKGAAPQIPAISIPG